MPHQRFRSHPQPDQVMRQLVGARVQLRIAQRLLAKHHRNRIRRARNLRLKQRRQCRVRHLVRRRVEALQQCVPFVGSEPPDDAAAASGAATAASSSRTNRMAIAAAVSGSNRSRLYSSIPSIPRSSPSAPNSRQVRRSDRTSLPGRQRFYTHLCRERPSSPGRVLQRQHHLKQRVSRQ